MKEAIVEIYKNLVRYGEIVDDSNLRDSAGVLHRYIVFKCEDGALIEAYLRNGEVRGVKVLGD